MARAGTGVQGWREWERQWEGVAGARHPPSRPQGSGHDQGGAEGLVGAAPFTSSPSSCPAAAGSG